MRHNYTFPSSLGIEKLDLTDNMFNHLGFWLGLDLGEETSDEDELSKVEVLKVIDIWLGVTELTAGAFILLCGYFETGGSQNSHGYSYHRDQLDEEEETYLVECLNKSIFGKYLNVTHYDDTIEIDVICDYNDKSEARLAVDLFHHLDALYNASEYHYYGPQED